MDRNNGAPIVMTSEHGVGSKCFGVKDDRQVWKENSSRAESKPAALIVVRNTWVTVLVSWTCKAHRFLFRVSSRLLFVMTNHFMNGSLATAL